MNIIFLMAGEGRRFKQNNQQVVKPLIDVLGKPMAVQAIKTLGLHGKIIVVLQQNETGFLILDTLKKYFLDIQAVFVEKLTEGPACSALAAKDLINNDEQLIITNCDQILTWDSQAFQTFLNHIHYDGVIVTYHCESTKNSYAKTNNKGIVEVIKEKEVISDISLNGVHWWKKGSYFVDAAESMINSNDKNAGEYYVGPSYNYMIKAGRKVGIYHIPVSHHHAIGVPEDLERYIKNASS